MNLSPECGQARAVVMVFLMSVHLEHLWRTRPTAEALKLLAANGGYLSSGEFLILQIAFEIWDGRGHVHLADIMTMLDPKRLRLLSSYLGALCYGGPGVEAWLAEHSVSCNENGEAMPLEESPASDSHLAWVTVADAAQQLGVARSTVLNWIDKCDLVANRVSGKWWVSVSSIRLVVANRKRGAPTRAERSAKSPAREQEKARRQGLFADHDTAEAV